MHFASNEGSPTPTDSIVQLRVRDETQKPSFACWRRSSRFCRKNVDKEIESDVISVNNSKFYSIKTKSRRLQCLRGMLFDSM